MSPTTTARRLTAVALSAAGVLALATVPAQAEAATADVTGRYVALGDSFTAGPLIPGQYGRPVFCLRSRKNYPNLVAQALGSAEFHDASCSGATTEHMTRPQGLPLDTENAPQLDALTPDTDLVTLGIGGNDFGFAEILITCATLSATDPAGDPCRDRYVDDEGGDELARRADETGEKVAAVLAEIAERSPEATVVVVGYLQILPAERGCWPLVPIARGDVAYLDAAQSDLNTVLAKEAAEAGAVFVDVGERGHDVCAAADEKWVEGIFPTRPAAPVHPNASGMAATAQRVLEAVGVEQAPLA
ncbi:SGNH/GDSL hydrolase family protein [Marinactinospora thermotolerans]|uniref:GDSL-like Lipase/Acylhydrolase family protein n=1 Tax=Marinactinospora thermotolerans DSM 45154 TaxID=1122192 RepID=A0A1T4SSB0_9ACTN|nr:SGNH/GDSL hydrolase family protein [Marinactinospora thermotolerans]SKA31200.1 GDSL-like Lipase/Acylhydrolase family protein [Marinactinospora thermotolerans DSM 45154]